MHGVRNPVLQVRLAREAADSLAGVKQAMEESIVEVKALTQRIAGIEAQNEELQKQLRTVQTQLADVAQTLKKVLPDLMTKKHSAAGD